MTFLYGANVDHVLAFVTGFCTTLSLAGSLVVIMAYNIAKKQTNPRAAKLIRNLAVADFVWFSAVFIESIFWIFTGPDGEIGEVPDGLCYVFSPLITVSRVSSLMWTSVVAFDVLESVTRRSWFTPKESATCTGDNRYYLFVYGFSLPGGIATIIVHSWKQSGFGCSAGYERIGEWYEVVLYELIPIMLGFIFNVYVFWKVRLRMAKRAFPLSVRKRRRRVMFNYIRVCIVCWTPMMMFYVLEMCGVHSAMFNIISRGLLYLTGFFNFLVFGMQVCINCISLLTFFLFTYSINQDLYLKRSMQLCLQTICCGYTFGRPVGQSLLNKHLEKTVMFADEDKLNADIIKDKKSMYRNHRLSREDKRALYKLRPDLNLKSNSVSTEDDMEPRADAVIVSWDGAGLDVSSSIDSNSRHSALDIGSVVFARSPEKDHMRYRPGTPKAPSAGTRMSDQDMEWDAEDRSFRSATPSEAEASNTDEWLKCDPTQSLLGATRDAALSTSIRSDAPDNLSSSSSGDEEDEEDVILLQAMIAAQTDNSK